MVEASSRIVVATFLAGLALSAAQRDPVIAILPGGLVREAGEWTQLNAGGVVVTILPARDHEVTVFAAARVDADLSRFVASVEQLDFVQNSRYVRMAGRFSNPPRLEDLCTLVLDDGDLQDIQRCRPGACDLKLGDAEIAALRRTIAAAGPGWKLAVQVAFRQLMLDRLLAYRRQGHAAMPPYHDKRERIGPDAEFRSIVAAASWLTLDVPDLPEYLVGYPRLPRAGVDEFFYWSVEAFGGKPITSVTHASVIRNDDWRLPAIVVTAKQIFATHYVTGSLGVLAIVRGQARGPELLVYLNRSRVDLLQGMFSGILRRQIEGRIRSEAPGALDTFRRRIERAPSRD